MNLKNKTIMYNERIENLIKAALADGELTEKEKQILSNKQKAESNQKQVDIIGFAQEVCDEIREVTNISVTLSQNAALIKARAQRELSDGKVAEYDYLTELENGGPILPETEQETEKSSEPETNVEMETGDEPQVSDAVSHKKLVALSAILLPVIVVSAFAVVLIKKKK